MKRLSFAFALVLTIALPAAAQVEGGNISGTVRDEQRGVMPGASVTAQGVDATSIFTTEANGQFRFLNLAPGLYKISVVLTGFPSVAVDTVVAVGKNVDLPLTLRV